MLGSEHICWTLCNLFSDICSAGSERKRHELDLLGLFNRISERLKGLMEYVGKELLLSIQGASRAYKECLDFNRYLLCILLSLVCTSSKESNTGGTTSVLYFSLPFKVLMRSRPFWRLHTFLKIQLRLGHRSHGPLSHRLKWMLMQIQAKPTSPYLPLWKEGGPTPNLKTWNTCEYL